MKWLIILPLLARSAAAFSPAPVFTASTQLNALTVDLDISAQMKTIAAAIASVDFSGVESVSTDIANIGAVAAVAGAGPTSVAAVLGLALVGALAYSAPALGSASKASEKTVANWAEPKPEPIDISVPYNAASMLAYMELKGVDKIDDMAEYETFKPVYEAYTVARVSLKKATREYEAFTASMAAAAKE